MKKGAFTIELEQDVVKELTKDGHPTIQEVAMKVSYYKEMENHIGGLILSMNRFYSEFGCKVPSSISAFTERAILVRQIWDRIEGKVDVSEWRKIYEEQDARKGVLTN